MQASVSLFEIVAFFYAATEVAIRAELPRTHQQSVEYA